MNFFFLYLKIRLYIYIIYIFLFLKNKWGGANKKIVTQTAQWQNTTDVQTDSIWGLMKDLVWYI